MSVYTQIDQLIEYMPGHSPDSAEARTNALADEIRVLILKARKLHRYYERDCNEPSTPARDMLTARLEAQIRAACRGLGIDCKFNQDPRGYPVKLMLPLRDGRRPHNTWGGEEEGWGIG